MTRPECTSCAAPVADQAYLCAACGDRLARALGDVPALAEELQTQLSRQTRVGDPVGSGSRATSRPLPYDPRASLAGAHLRGILVTWVRLVAEERAYYAPKRQRDLPDDTLAAMSCWMQAEVEWLRHHEAGAEAVDEITTAVDHVRWAIDRPPDRWYAGPCDRCDEDLYARPKTVQVECGCGATYDVASRRTWLLTTAEDVLAHASLVARALTGLLDRQVSVDTIRGWAHKGRLLPHALDLQGRPLYRVGDVIELVFTATTRRRNGATGHGDRVA